MQRLRLITDALLAQRGSLIGWAPVFMGLGIGSYFALRVEPATLVWAALAGIGLIFLVLSRFVPVAVAPVCMGLVLICLGAGLAKYRSEAVAGPVLDYRYFGPIQGRVVNIDRSGSDAPRLTLDQVVLYNLPPSRTPTRVRVSIHGEQPLSVYRPGDHLILTGHLGPPSGPAEPGSFDFQRHAWFLSLGAVGYTRTPVLRAGPPSEDWRLAVFRSRTVLSNAVQAGMPLETGGFAVAITTGDRSAISQGAMANLRAANLAHLLAISGLHMGLLTGFVFAVLRSGLALSSRLVLQYPIKKIAAVFAIFIGAIYLALSGGNVATERAFIMVTAMFVAVILDRRALTLRAVAIAAVIVLTLRPEALVGPGFQMSFAATTALVFVFGLLRRVDMYRFPKWLRGVFSVVISSGVAGLATAPFAAAHFNQMAHYGLIANVTSVPVMGVLVMPAAVLAACLTPFGLESAGFWLMDIGLRWILFVADLTASQPGAVGHIKAPSTAVLPLVAFGLLTIVLWQGRARLIGIAPVVLGAWFWVQTERPAILVADTGGFIGVLTPEGRDLSRATGHGFVASIWLENDGAPVSQEIAAARDGIYISGRMFKASLEGWDVLQVSGKTALADLSGCGGADVLISNQKIESVRPCQTFDLTALQSTGALAISPKEDGLHITTARDVSGVRPWNSSGYRSDVTGYVILTRKSGSQTPAITAED